jgi:hypothetical protein
LALLFERIAEVVVGLGEIGLEPQRPLIPGHRLVQFALGLERGAEVVVRLDVGLLEGDGSSVVANGILGATKGVQG